MAGEPLNLLGFSHICVAVSDAERSKKFYEDLFGYDVFFDVDLDGEAMEAVTGESGAKGRMIGGLVGGVVVELLEFSHRKFTGADDQNRLGYTNISLSVPDLNAAYAQVKALGYEPKQKPVDIGGVRMFFVTDPDGTAVEIIEYPNGEANSAQMWRGA